MAQIITGINTSSPLSMDIDRYGTLYAVNGLTRGIRYDGTTALAIGITGAVGLNGVSLGGSTKNYVSDIVVETPGQNYISQPLIYVDGVSFSSALKDIRAILRGGRVDSVTFDKSRTDFVTAPEIRFVGGQATGAAMGVQSLGGVAEVDVSEATGGWTAEPAVVFSATSGVTVIRHAAGRAVLHYDAWGATDGKVAAVIVTDPGEYIVGPSMVARQPPVSAVLIPAQGATLSVRYSGYASTVTITAAGTEYIVPPQIKLIPSGPKLLGGGAIAGCTAQTGSLTGATVIQPGAGYDGLIRAELVSEQAVAKASIRPRFAGKYVGAYRYVDGAQAGDICDLFEIDCGDGASGILWRGMRSPSAPDSSRITHVELWRSTADQATTLYLVARLPVGASLYTDRVMDQDLVDPKRLRWHYTVTDVVVTNGGSGYSSTPTVVFNSGDVTATATASVSGGAVASVSVTDGGKYFGTVPTATISGGGGSGATLSVRYSNAATADDLGESFVLPIFTEEGYPNAARFGVPPSDASIICIFQDRAWYSGIPGKPNTIYFSEQDEAESVPSVYEINLQNSGRDNDSITALFNSDSSLYIAQRRHMYRLTVSGHPLASSSISLVANRGSLNQRCTCTLDGVTYVADDLGVYVFGGGDADPISDPVANYWSEPLIDFTKSKWFCLQSDPRDRVVRFFFSQIGDAGDYPTRALCYSPVTKAWWTEKYAYAIGSASIAISGGQQRCLVGKSSGFARLGEGQTDGGVTIPYSLKTGNMRLNGDPRRGLRLTYDPTTSQHVIGVRAYYNGSTAARTNAAAVDTGAGFVTVNGSTESTLNIDQDRSSLAKANGYAQLYLAGRMDDKSVGGDRAVAIEIAGTNTNSVGNRLVIHQLAVEGVE